MAADSTIRPRGYRSGICINYYLLIQYKTRFYLRNYTARNNAKRACLFIARIQIYHIAFTHEIPVAIFTNQLNSSLIVTFQPSNRVSPITVT